MNSIEQAKAIATAAHSGQFRRDGVTPYIRHPEAVASRVQDEKAQMVAWLHDVIEDTLETGETLRAKGLPDDVVEAVELMTHPETVPYMDYLKSIKENPLSKEVKIADMLTNLADTPTKKQIKKYAEGLLLLVD